ncbi:hypothetical protein HIM_07351 [Hirsutella minnesotensis 3608]|uniref:Uncharacterized protein n=1 Tax=Hirsutella minnesotensis 3608 TaxID=1043627 RepID=A0A0F7ZYZ8_9HYPO|nr:hypothetical protein HIM_07351 [Hirsutella minnesotensis 3608]
MTPAERAAERMNVRVFIEGAIGSDLYSTGKAFFIEPLQQEQKANLLEPKAWSKNYLADFIAKEPDQVLWCPGGRAGESDCTNDASPKTANWPTDPVRDEVLRRNTEELIHATVLMCGLLATPVNSHPEGITLNMLGRYCGWLHDYGRAELSAESNMLRLISGAVPGFYTLVYQLPVPGINIGKPVAGCHAWPVSSGPTPMRGIRSDQI